MSSKEQAVELTGELDTVLANGGFRVKGWSSNERLTDKDSESEQKESTLLESTEEEKVLGVG